MLEPVKAEGDELINSKHFNKGTMKQLTISRHVSS
jgi:hypothetical protein